MSSLHLPACAAEGVDLSALTTYKLGGPARYYAEPDTEPDLRQALAFASGLGLEVLVLGRGSNLVISDRGWPGLVLRLGQGFVFVSLEPDGVMAAGAATPLPRLAREAVDAGRGGLEFFVGIPGSVGGAVRMNAGGHGSDTAGCLIDARVAHIPTGEVTEVSVEGLGLGYRRSNLGPDQLVLSARFSTSRCDPDAGREELRRITRWRRQHQPGGTLNAGSVFKNPPEGPAGKIIDELGLKGLRVGGASVSRKHANFFEADADATASDVFQLVAEVRKAVADKTGIDLEPEVQFAGEFE